MALQSFVIISIYGEPLSFLVQSNILDEHL